MTDNDVAYFHLCVRSGFVNGPLLDIGSAKFNEGLPNICDLAREKGIKATGVDMAPGPGVDIVADFSQEKPPLTDLFKSVAIFNVIEHTFDPVRVLTNARALVAEGGHLLVVAPAIWPLHGYPVDCVRFNPDWFREFARRNKLTLIEDSFLWMSQEFGPSPVGEKPVYPTGFNQGRGLKKMITSLANRMPTYFRTHWHPAMLSLGAVFKN